MYLLPFADRLLWFSSALSSFPGQVPTQEVNSAAEENVLAVTLASAMICKSNGKHVFFCGRVCRYSCFSDDLLRRINAQTGHFRQPAYRILVRFHGLRDQAVQLCDL